MFMSQPQLTPEQIAQMKRETLMCAARFSTAVIIFRLCNDRCVGITKNALDQVDLILIPVENTWKRKLLWKPDLGSYSVISLDKIRYHFGTTTIKKHTF
ncbi:hypothetical protein BB558_004474 [Smittium angustum]|uniref:Uncharacterized protein n=1 Tax=Smittium angustum TaxID=133377 RepID=A0A2U1J366_SMIAN|nr:hypothetical protein BB558_004474 [Smittium angustum]